MIRRSIKFVLPSSLAEAAELLAKSGTQGRVVGGGSVLVPTMSAGLDQPSVIIDIANLGLNTVVEKDGGALIGARATYATLLRSKVIRSRLPLLHAMVGEVTGGPGLWNLATLGGSSCYANPASDGPACLTALRANFHLCSAYGERVIDASEFFMGAFKTGRRAHEILTHIFVPFEDDVSKVAYFKLKHSGSSWPMVTAACQRSMAHGDVYLRLAVGGLAERPVYAEWRTGSSTNVSHANDLALEILAKVDAGWSDELADGSYRLKAARSVVARVLLNVLESE